VKSLTCARIAAAVGLFALGVETRSLAQGERAQQNAAAPVYRPVRPTYASRGEIQVLPVQGSVYLLAGAGSNITVQVGPDAVMVVDSNDAAMSQKVLAAIRTLSPAPIRYIVNTSSDPDHVGGNEALATSAEGTGQRHPRSGRARLRAREHVRAHGQPEGRIGSDADRHTAH
jgi:glyoxylase-like metal-dependent hydrolase (beta-lactamase superfamily II)